MCQCLRPYGIWTKYYLVYLFTLIALKYQFLPFFRPHRLACKLCSQKRSIVKWVEPRSLKQMQQKMQAVPLSFCFVYKPQCSVSQFIFSLIFLDIRLFGTASVGVCVFFVVYWTSFEWLNGFWKWDTINQTKLHMVKIHAIFILFGDEKIE